MLDKVSFFISGRHVHLILYDESPCLTNIDCMCPALNNG